MNGVFFKSGITVGTAGPSLGDLRRRAKNDPVTFIQRIEQLVNDGKLKLGMFGDLRGLYQATADIQVPVTLQIGGTTRAVMASAFPILTGTTMIKEINDAYLDVAKVGDQLVTEIDDNKKITTIANVHSLDKNIEEVKEADDFPEISADEEKVEIRHKRNGRKLSITQEMIDENELADIVSRVNALGTIAGEWIEEQTLRRVTDHDGCAASPAEPYVYRPGGTGTALYSSTANTPGTRAPSGNRKTSNALADDTDLDNARALLATMKNSRGKSLGINWSDIQLLVPYSIYGMASTILNSEYVPGVVNEVSNYGPRGQWNITKDRLVTTPKLDDLSASAWYLGAFRKQFRRKWKLRFEYVTLGTDTQAYLNSRIAFQARIAWDCEIGAVDYVYVVQNLAATTAPKDA